MRLLQKPQTASLYDPTSPLLDTDTAAGLRAGIRAGMCVVICKATLVTKPEGGSNPGLHRRLDGQTKRGARVCWRTTQPKEGRKFRQLLQHGWTWSESVSQMPKDKYCVLLLLSSTSTRGIHRDRKQNSGSRSSGRKAREVFCRCKVAVWDEEKVLGTDGGDGCLRNMAVFNATKLFAEK